MSGCINTSVVIHRRIELRPLPQVFRRPYTMRWIDMGEETGRLGSVSREALDCDRMETTCVKLTSVETGLRC